MQARSRARCRDACWWVYRPTAQIVVWQISAHRSAASQQSTRSAKSLLVSRHESARAVHSVAHSVRACRQTAARFMAAGAVVVSVPSSTPTDL